MTMKVYSTLTRKIEEFEPLHGDSANMFVGGVAPYDYTRLGHAKTYIAFYMIAKYLRYRGYTVFYLRNVTDIDDHLNHQVRDWYATANLEGRWRFKTPSGEIYLQRGISS